MRRLQPGIMLVVLLVVLATVPVPALASVNGEPNLDVGLADGSVAPGEKTTLTFVLTNDADISQVSLTNPQLQDEVTTAKGVSVTVDSGDAPVSIDSGRQLIGSVADGGRATADVGVTVDDDARLGTYDLDVTVQYSHASVVSDRTGAVTQKNVKRSFDVEMTVERDDVRFRVVDSASTVRAGESGTFTATIEQTGQETARDVRLQLRSLDPAVTPAGTGTASRYLGNWTVGERRTVSYRVAASRGVTGEPHALELVPTYENVHGDATEGRALAVGLTPIAGERFRVATDRFQGQGTGPPLAVGGRVQVGVNLRNRGPGAASNASVELETTSSVITVDGGSAADRSVGRVSDGEFRTATFDVGATTTARGGNYTLAATVTYDDTTGTTVTSRSWPVTVRVQPAPTVEVDAVNSTLYVGERGRITGTVRNTGSTTARNAVLRVTDAPAGIQFTETGYPVGDLTGGEQATFSLPAVVAAQTTAGPRAVTYVLEYETPDGTVVRSDPLRANTPVRPERDTFEVAVQNGTFAPDSSDTLVLTVTNAGARTRTDVRATLAPGPPFTSSAPSVFIGTVDPGESTTVRFPIDTDEDAVTSGHAIPVNVTADTEHGLTERERHRAAVQVATDSQPVETVPIAVLGGLSVVLLVGVGYWWLRRR